jgi:hypothetical protein
VFICDSCHSSDHRLVAYFNTRISYEPDPEHAQQSSELDPPSIPSEFPPDNPTVTATSTTNAAAIAAAPSKGQLLFFCSDSTALADGSTRKIEPEGSLRERLNSHCIFHRVDDDLRHFIVIFENEPKKRYSVHPQFLRSCSSNLGRKPSGKPWSYTFNLQKAKAAQEGAH